MEKPSGSIRFLPRTTLRIRVTLALLAQESQKISKYLLPYFTQLFFPSFLSLAFPSFVIFFRSYFVFPLNYLSFLISIFFLFRILFVSRVFIFFQINYSFLPFYTYCLSIFFSFHCLFLYACVKAYSENQASRSNVDSYDIPLIGDFIGERC